MNRERLLEQIRRAVREVEPGAEIILYGSRSRGNAIAESDWDFLVLVDGPLNEERTDRIRHRLYEVEWCSGEVISSIWHALKRPWKTLVFSPVPSVGMPVSTVSTMPASMLSLLFFFATVCPLPNMLVYVASMVDP